jgi:four helix bundle protein
MELGLRWSCADYRQQTTDNGGLRRKYGIMELRIYGFTEDIMESLSTLLTEEQKSKAQILELSYDFSCRIIRLYKFLNQKNLCKADKDIVRTLGLQMLRSATSINDNINEAQHPQSDADFLSKAGIALKEARETENWLHLLHDNGYISKEHSESILHDCIRINKILVTITAKVRERLKNNK